MTDQSTVSTILHIIQSWAEQRKDIIGLALIGSHARGEARRDSDLDLVILTDKTDLFHSSSNWLQEIKWQQVGASVKSTEDANYGVVWSRHVMLSTGLEIEFCFAPLWWITNPVESKSLEILNKGNKILLDPEKYFHTALQCKE